MAYIYIFLLKAKRKIFVTPQRWIPVPSLIYETVWFCPWLIFSGNTPEMSICLQGLPLACSPAWTSALWSKALSTKAFDFRKGLPFMCLMRAPGSPLWPLSYLVVFNCLSCLFKLMIEALSKKLKKKKRRMNRFIMKMYLAVKKNLYTKMLFTFMKVIASDII